MSALAVKNLSKRFGGLVVTNDVTFSVQPGECHALIGPNGAGKTTLISQLMGELVSDGGTISLRGRRIETLPSHARARAGLARSFQITNLVKRRSVLDNMLLALIGRNGHAFTFFRPLSSEAALITEATDLLAHFSFAGRLHEPVSELSHGEQRVLELAMALAAKPAVLLLDEPMAGLGHEETIKMTDILGELRGEIAMLLVEHDMDAVFRLADRVTVLVSGSVLMTDQPAVVRSDPRVRDLYLGENAS